MESKCSQRGRPFEWKYDDGVDRFGREITYLRISVTDRCNLKCTYCMPLDAHHVEREEVLSFEEIHRIVKVAVQQRDAQAGLTKRGKARGMER